MRLVFAVFAAALLLASAAPAAFAAEEPVVFEMADGSFYHPASGLRAETRQRLLNLLAAPLPEAIPAAPEPAQAEAEIVSAAPAGSLPSAVERARALLEERVAATRPAAPDVVSSYDVWVDVTLAVWNSRTDEIRLVSVQKNGVKLRVETADADMGLSVAKNNGVNSEFAVAASGEQHVVAVQYPIFKNISKTKTPRYELEDVVYTPYSRGLHTPEMVAWGQHTLRTAIARVYDRLRAEGIKSRAYPDLLLADVVDPALVEGIAVIEHLSEASLLSPNRDRAIESVYVILGGNQEDAYAYSRSSAGARGLVQFIPSTYALMAKRKDLGLNPDFEAGMADPQNAIRAQVAYLDAELAGMPLAVRDLYFVDKTRVGEYMAGAYNGGGARVRWAIETWGDGWSELHEKDFAEMAASHKKLDAEVARLKANVKKEADAAKLKTLKAELAKTQKEHDVLANKEIAAKKKTLRPETAGYLLKLREVMSVLRPPAPPQSAA